MSKLKQHQQIVYENTTQKLDLRN